MLDKDRDYVLVLSYFKHILPLKLTCSLLCLVRSEVNVLFAVLSTVKWMQVVSEGKK